MIDRRVERPPKALVAELRRGTQERGRVAVADFGLAEKPTKRLDPKKWLGTDLRIEIGDERPRERSCTSGLLLAELLHPTTPI